MPKPSASAGKLNASDEKVRFLKEALRLSAKLQKFDAPINQSGRSSKQRSRKTASGNSIQPPPVNRTMYRMPAAVSSAAAMGVGLPDLRLKFRYPIATVLSGNGTLGVNGTLYPQLDAGVIGIGAVPILPADIQSVSPGVGFGVAYINDVMKHYARVRYNDIKLYFEPFGAGQSTTSTATVVYAPFRGPVKQGSYSGETNASGSYGTAGNNSAPQWPYSSVSSCQGSKTFPSWHRQVCDLTPYIAGGSGPKQNEFGVWGSSTTGVLASLNIPCCFRIGGVCDSASGGVSYMDVYCEVDMNLLDFAVSATVPSGSGPVGSTIAQTKARVTNDAVDVKAPPPLRMDYKEALSRRREATSPTQSLLGAELQSAYAAPATARTVSAAMPIPTSKDRRGT